MLLVVYTVRKLMEGYLFSELTPDLNDHKQLV